MSASNVRDPAARDLDRPASHRALAAAFASTFSAIALAALCACAPLGTKGTMPPVGPDGRIDPSAGPDFIAVAGPDGGVVGYIPKSALLGDKGADMTVYADDLRTVVGRMVPGRGFVPLGVDPASVPTMPALVGPSGSALAGIPNGVTLFVRNQTPAERWLVVRPIGGTTLPENGQGYSPGIGAGSFDVPVGSWIELVAAAPQSSGAVPLQVVYRASGTTESATAWIDLTAQSGTRVGEGSRSWWEGDPPAC